MRGNPPDVDPVFFEGFTLIRDSAIAVMLDHLEWPFPWDAQFSYDARAFHCDPITLLTGVISSLSILPEIALGNGSLFSFSDLFPINWLVHWEEHVPAKD